MNNVMGVLLGCCVLGLTACGQFGLSDLPTEYTETIRDLGFEPVYPPREGFQVGDVYFRAVYTKDPYDPNKNFSVLAGSIREMITLSHKFSDSRIPFLDTLDGGRDKMYKQLDYDRAADDRDESRRGRMLQVAFPNVTATISKGASAGIFGKVFSMVGAAARRERITISFPDVRFMRVPFGQDKNWEQILKLFFSEHLPSQDAHDLTLRGIYDFPGCNDEGYRCQYTIIIAVYYARVLDYIFGDASSLSVSTGMIGEPSQNGEGAGGEKPAVPPLIFINAADEVEFDEMATRFAESLQKAFADVGGRSAVLNTGQASQRAFQVRQTFAKPVAIAWEGYNFSVSGGAAETGGTH